MPTCTTAERIFPRWPFLATAPLAALILVLAVRVPSCEHKEPAHAWQR